MSDLQNSQLPGSLPQTNKQTSQDKTNEGEHFDIQMLENSDDQSQGLNSHENGQEEDDRLLKETLESVANNITASNALSTELSNMSDDVAAAVVEAVAAVTADTNGNEDSTSLDLPKDLEAHLNNATGESGWENDHPMDDEELQLHFQKVFEREEEEEREENRRTEQQEKRDQPTTQNDNDESNNTDRLQDHDTPVEVTKKDIRSDITAAKEKENINLPQVTIPRIDKTQPKDTSSETKDSESSNGKDTTLSTFESYKGLSIPANSELFKGSTSALEKYNKLQASTPLSETIPALMNVQLSALPLTLTAPSNLPFNIQLLIHTLPVLDNLATQILRIIAQGPYENIMEIVANADSTYSGIAFTNLVNIFETTKKIYNSDEHPFFTVEDATSGLWKFGQDAPFFLKGKEDSIESTLRKVNLATFLVATLGLVDLGFFYLNEAFLDVFCPPQPLDYSQSLSEITPRTTSLEADVKGNFFRPSSKPQISTKFLKSHALLYLDLKTQAFISAVELNNEGSRNVDGTIRKNISNEEILNDLFPNNLDEILYRRKDPEYDPEKTKLQRNSMFFTPSELDFLVRCDNRKRNLLNSTSESSLVETYEWVKFLSDLLEYVSKNVGFLIWGPNGRMKNELENLKRASSTLESEPVLGIKKLKALEKDNENKLNDSNNDDKTESNSLGFYKQYYESSQKAKVPKKKVQVYRRVWSKEEEEMLIEGLKKKGTQWAAILSLYGPGGSVNEVLKNRTTLQLKDKARNWKYYYLRRNIAIPDYLANVTGELENYPQDSTNTVSRPKTGMLKEQQPTQAESSTSQPTPDSQESSADSLSVSEQVKKSDALPTINNETTESAAESASVNKESLEGTDEASNYEDLIKDLFAKQAGAKEQEESTEKNDKNIVDNKMTESQNDSVTAELSHLVTEAFK